MEQLKCAKLNKNNKIYIRKSNKFKTVGISFVYKMKFEHENVTAFNILAKYLGNCCAIYPSIEKINKYIESLYGTTVGIKASYSGSLFTFNIFANLVNPKYVDDKQLFKKVVSITYEMIFNPLIIDGALDENIFNICKENCNIDIQSQQEFNMSYVLRTLKNNITNEKNNAFASDVLGDKVVLNKLNNKNILKYYKKLLTAPLDIYVTGDVNYNETLKVIKEYYQNKHSKNIDASVFDMIRSSKVEPIIIKKEVNQAKLAIVYKIPVLFDNKEHYAFRVARLILSGTLFSKLSKVIREQMGLCYSINTNYSSYYGTFIVTTGVASENIDKVIKEVDNQINEVKKTNITSDEFNAAKEALINDLLSIDDTLNGTLNMIKTYQNFNQTFILEDELRKYENVTLEDVVKVSNKLEYITYGVLTKE